MNDGLKNDIASLKASLLKPDPDLDAGQTKDMQTRLDYLQELLASKESSGESARWLPCGLCHGRGRFEEECAGTTEAWGCSVCNGQGGSWI